MTLYDPQGRHIAGPAPWSDPVFDPMRSADAHLPLQRPTSKGVTHTVTSHQFTHHDVPGQPGWKEARPVPNTDTHRVDIRIGGRLVLSQDVADYTLEHDKDGVRLSATYPQLTKVDTEDNPALTGTPLPAGFQPIVDESNAPDAQFNEEPESVPVVEAIHDGKRDVEAEEAQRKADAKARREAAKHPQGSPAADAAQGDTDSAS